MPKIKASLLDGILTIDSEQKGQFFTYDGEPIREGKAYQPPFIKYVQNKTEKKYRVDNARKLLGKTTIVLKCSNKACPKFYKFTAPQSEFIDFGSVTFNVTTNAEQCCPTGGHILTKQEEAIKCEQHYINVESVDIEDHCELDDSETIRENFTPQSSMESPKDDLDGQDNCDDDDGVATAMISLLKAISTERKKLAKERKALEDDKRDFLRAKQAFEEEKNSFKGSSTRKKRKMTDVDFDNNSTSRVYKPES